MSSWLRNILLSTLIAGVAVQTSWAAEAIIRPGYVVIKLKPQAAQTARASKSAMSTGLNTLDQLNVRNNIRDIRPAIPQLSGASLAANAGRDVHGLSRFYTIELQPGTDVLSAVAEYAKDPNVELAEPDYIVPLDLVPNDPNYVDQYTHFDGQDDDIDTQEAWDLETGDSTIIIGVIDSGIQYDHPDLIGNIWVNPGEDLDGDRVVWDADDMNGIDDDGNSRIDDLIGWDFMNAQGGCAVGEDCNGQDNDPIDFNGHGTHCNGIVASTTGNSTGGAGIAGGNRAVRRPGVKLMGLRAGYEANTGQGFVVMTSCAAACDYAIAKGAMGINCSWGSSGALIRTAILNAVSNGLVVCKAAGNDDTDVPDIIDTTFGVLAVASLEATGVRSSFSNYGDWVDLCAPGGGIFSTYSSHGIADYAFLGGTSMASPTVLGVAALLKSHHPWFTKTEIDTLLILYTDYIDDQNLSYAGLLGTGRVNAFTSLSQLTTADYDIDTGFGFAPLTVNFTNTSPNAPSAPYEYNFGDGDTSPDPNTSHIYDEPGLYTVQFTGNGPSGPHSRKNPNQVIVVRDTIEYGDTLGLATVDTFNISVRVNNTHEMTSIKLPLRLTGPADIRVDSFTTSPLLSGWTNARVLGGSTQGAWLLTMGTGDPLPVGGGYIGQFWLRVVSGSGGNVEVVDSGTVGVAQHTLNLTSEFVSFKPRFIGGSATIGGLCDCSCHGDPTCDGDATILDVVGVVNVAFRNETDTIDPACTHVGRADMNCDCVVDIVDVVTVVNRAFRNDQTPPCDACVSACP